MISLMCYGLIGVVYLFIRMVKMPRILYWLKRHPLLSGCLGPVVFFIIIGISLIFGVGLVMAVDPTSSKDGYVWELWVNWIVIGVGLFAVLVGGISLILSGKRNHDFLMGRDKAMNALLFGIVAVIIAMVAIKLMRDLY
ncbi:hypothetical protein C8P63_12080 [Melghirimyces profundicolus]|uniref:Uncharacterized protein n=1 Tax=Melghirimyces profundicolus TaxID=1242148 RepID=A0A2T6BGT6_9BACL|nr:hypothetical protein [Melghirimyces profundicolus]PTX55283.1 hypothetical protein C8P63_12080 [Melghirimyces profundicolus]